MLLVVFGAGASYDSVPHIALKTSIYDQARPPLANQLFGNRRPFVEVMQLYADCLPLIPRLRGEVQVEQILARFQDEAATYPPRHRQLAAIRYYLQRMLLDTQAAWLLEHNGITNYRTVLDEINRWRVETKEQVCFVTFNYDTMLDEAMRQELQFNIGSMASYVDREDYMLIKLHGSVNWGRMIEGGFPPPPVSSQLQLIHGAAELKISDTYVLEQNHPMLYHNDVLVFPALAIPLEKKDSFECPRQHVLALGNILTKVTKMITIGWRATEDRFLEMLKKPLSGLAHNIDLLIVSGDQEGAEETFENLGITIAKERCGFLESGFTGLTNDLGTLNALLRQSPWQRGR